VSTYNLTWEEFLEFQEGALPRPSIASFIATIFIAIAVGVFGVVLTYAVDRGSKLMASSFCWLSLVLFLGAFWDLRIRTARRRSRGVEELRAIYQQYYSGEREFGFDQEKWTLQTQSGKQEVLWKALSNAVEWSSIVTLSAVGQVTTAIPKRMLSSDELNALRRLAIGSIKNAWRSRMSLLDYLLTEVPSLWHRHPFLMAEAHVAGLFFFVMIANDMYQTTGPCTYVGWTLAGLFLFLTITTQFWYFLIKYLTSHNELVDDWAVDFTANGVRVKTSKVDVFRAWSTFKQVREAAPCYLLYVDSSRYNIFPKRCVPTERRASVRDLLYAKLAKQA
jgi:hypothetical protein